VYQYGPMVEGFRCIYKVLKFCALTIDLCFNFRVVIALQLLLKEELQN